MVDALLEQASWLTPTSLFLLLNLVIATILLSSRPKKPASSPPQLARAPSLFSRVTSFNFSNYSSHSNDEDNDNDNNNGNDNDEHRGNQQHPQHRHYHSSPSFFSRLGSFNFSGRANEPDPDQSAACDEGVSPDVPEAPADLGQGQGHVRMARATSFLSRVASFTYRVRDPLVDDEGGQTVTNNNNNNNNNDDGNNDKDDNGKKVEKAKKKKKKKVSGETTSYKKKEEEVDAKADDFINKFKQQLKMQRIESLMRYRSA
ncbi:hypothetical protein RND81_06G186900 [Saponaria officinalis]|uniref:DUF4408 domain-containing protein n=1 Tax=Saponaria officinalis TaxID=3572 RepID=A0AAW1KCC9_SAPOF